MTRENGRDEEPREGGRVPEEEIVGGSAEARTKAGDDWTSWGAEDPAFFIKPSEGE